MRIRFPNPFGFHLPTAGQVVALRHKHGFSSGYAEFLCEQNGLRTDALPVFCNDMPASPFLEAGSNTQADADGGADLCHLYGLSAGRPCCDLELLNRADRNLFDGLFFCIGADHGGNRYVEVLAGPCKGWIGSLDRELYASARDLDHWLAGIGLDLEPSAPRDRVAAALCEPELGLIWLHAESIQAFVGQCIHLDDEGCAFVIDTRAACLRMRVAMSS